jgi:hypothetical protein
MPANDKNIDTSLFVECVCKQLSGAGIGLFILTPIYQMIYETYSYTGYFLLLGGLALQNCVFGATFKDSETEYAMRKANKNRNRKLGFKESISSYMEIVRARPPSNKK